jgi:hypothetical protein
MIILHHLIAFVRALLGLPGPWRFASVEVYGHRRHFGRVREIGWLGAERVRYGAAAVFSIQWVDERKGRERIEMFHAERARWRLQQEERDRREERDRALCDAVVSTVTDGHGTLIALLDHLAMWSGGDGSIVFTEAAEAERAIVDCADRRLIVEDPLGSGSYRLPTKAERDSIPF